jgi:hypothetical protein
MTTDLELTPDEVRSVMESRTQAALEAGPPPAPPAPTITQKEWSLLQLHRIAQQSRIVGSGIVANEPDPLQVLNAVAIVVLRSMREEWGGPFKGDEGLDSFTLSRVHSTIDRWLGILGADGNESGPASPGSG